MSVEEIKKDIETIEAELKLRQPFIDDIESIVSDHKSHLHRINRLKVQISEIEFNKNPDTESIRRAVIRGWGNAYTADANNKGVIYQMADWDRMARACGLTVDDKIYAIELMSGDIWEDYYSHVAVNKFKKANNLPYDDTYLLGDE